MEFPLPLGVAALLSVVVAELYRRWAVRRHILDLPNQRSSHRTPTPRGGGLGIVLGFYAGFGTWTALGGGVSSRSLGWLAGGALVAAVSFVDDLRGLPAVPRLMTHFLAAVLLTTAGVQQGQVPLLVAYPLAFLWVVAVTNIYNFMDGVDGLAASQGIVAGLAFLLAGVLVDNPLVALTGGLLASASAGFLVHNLPPARLFMGDVSSTFLGYSFAGIALLANLGVGGRRLPLEFGVVVLAPFLFDAVFTLGSRVVRREPWYHAHRSHFYQRLTRTGWNHGQVTGLYAACAVVAATAAIGGLLVEDGARVLLDSAAIAPMVLVVMLVRFRERRAREALDV